MTSVQRCGLLILLLVLTACAPISIATPTASAPTPNLRPALVGAGPAQRVELAAGRYQLIMFYSPI